MQFLRDYRNSSKVLPQQIMAEPSSSVQQSNSSSDAPGQIKKSGSSASASPSRKGNKIFNNIVYEQSRTQMKHHHVKSFWNNAALEVTQGTAGIDCLSWTNLLRCFWSFFHQLCNGTSRLIRPSDKILKIWNNCR